MPEDKAKASPKIFLSHSHRDKIFARRLAWDLEKGGAYVWLDEAELDIGDSLLDKIANAIQEVDFLAAILSPRSVDSLWVKKELSIAMTREVSGEKMKVLPILIEECNLPPFLKDKVWADFSSAKKYNETLLRVLKSVGIHKFNIVKKDQRIQASKNLHDLAHILINLVSNLLPTDYIQVVFRGSGDLSNKYIVCADSIPPNKTRYDSALLIGLVGRCIVEGRVIDVPDVSEETGYIAGEKSTKSEFVIPLLSRNSGAIGAINCESDSLAAFGSIDKERLFEIATTAAEIVDRNKWWDHENIPRFNFDFPQKNVDTTVHNEVNSFKEKYSYRKTT